MKLMYTVIMKAKKEEFDIDLDEFSDEIETWVIDELKHVGCDTARSVLVLDFGRTGTEYRPGKRNHC